MFRALFKKQLMEVNTWLIQDKKKGTNRNKAGMALLLVLYGILFGGLGGIFYMVGRMLCEPLVAADLGWLYFALMGLIAVALGVFGSVFNTYATLYKAKDNAFLLSMPIPPSYILAVRLFGVWMWSFIYEAIVFVPSLIVYWRAIHSNGSLTSAAVLYGVLLLLLLSVFILTLACILGWVVAKISNRLKHKSVITVLISLAFLTLYYLGYSRAYTVLQGILANAQAVGARMQGLARPLYWLGRAGEGDARALLFTTLLIIAFFAVVYAVMVGSFLKMAVADAGTAKKVYREKTIKARSPHRALLYKELRRFLSSPTYMLNCGLGTVFLLVIGIAALVKAAWLRDLLATFSAQTATLTPLLACAALCMAVSMNDLTAPSVSLEGKNLWLVHSLPLTAWQALRAKLELHLLLTEPPAVFCAICLVIALRPRPFGAVLILLLPMLFALLFAAFGLVLNLKAPNLRWTDETVPVKQSMGVLFSMLGGWILVIALTVLYCVLRNALTAEVYLSLCGIGLLGGAAALLLWLRHRGTAIFAAL